MIESMRIAGTATFSSTAEVLDDLRKFNYIFGSNGSGKTTITRVIANEDEFSACCVKWKAGAKLQAMVYNRDFVSRNFSQSDEIKGIFTLGAKNIETIKKIRQAKADLDAMTQKIAALNLGLHGDDGAGGKKGEQVSLGVAFKDKCWTQKQRHDPKFSGAFEGLRNNAEKFKSRILQEWGTNSATLETLADLEKRAETVYGPTPVAAQSIPAVELGNLLTYESDPILKKRVVGKEDVDIAAMIKRLGNSDWVREGRAFLEVNEKICPFCQQGTTDSFSKSLNDYFEETYERDIKAVNDLETNYKADAGRVQSQIAAILATSDKFIELEKLKTEKALLDAMIATNVQHLALKKKEPSQSVALESLANVLAAVTSLVKAANQAISAHNSMVANLSQERQQLGSQVWKYLLEVELKTVLKAYDTAQKNVSAAIESMTAQITTLTSEKLAKEAEIRNLERETTSVQPTINGINELLSSFGFRGFLLSKADNGTSYKLVRADGTAAKETLSEGESSFVSFLYFYHLLKGSDSESGMTMDRVVVFDDPVSSLDSDILFVVGSLIKGLCEEVRAGAGHIKQVFVLTHNVYFHKEVTFSTKRKNGILPDETFWIIRKSSEGAKLEKYNSNPIKTSYELLWNEVRRLDRSNHTIQNTLRRILENYFKILGGVDPDKIIALFDGTDKFVCKSLFSWINDGSHSAHDDIYLATDNSMVETYLKVFKAIFEKSDHLPHYEMMMREAGT